MPGNPRKTGHIIADINFNSNYLLCSCGWEGKPIQDEFKAHQNEAMNQYKSPIQGETWKKIYRIPEQVKDDVAV
jgi:hypothetical protein